MKAVVFGTGRIACGVLGEMVRDAGWDLVLVGRNADAVDDLRRHDGYRIRLVDGNSATERTIDGLTAVELGDRPTVLRHLADADVVLTAVGSGNLAGVAPVSKEALLAAAQGATDLHNLLAEYLPEEEFRHLEDALQLIPEEGWQDPQAE